MTSCRQGECVAEVSRDYAEVFYDFAASLELVWDISLILAIYERHFRPFRQETTELLSDQKSASGGGQCPLHLF